MPQVPRTTEQSVQPAARPDLRQNPNQTSLDTFGGGATADRAFNASRGATRAAFDIALQEKQRADNAKILEADLALSTKSNELETSLKSLRGGDALGVMETFNDEWKKAAGEIYKGLNNDAQRTAFSAKNQQKFLELQKSLNIHVNNEFIKHSNDLVSQKLELSRNNISKNYINPDIVAMGMAESFDALETQKKLNGMSDEWLENQWNIERSRIHKAVIETAAFDENDDFVQEYSKAISDELTTDDKNDLKVVQKIAERQKKEKKEEIQKQWEISLVEKSVSVSDIRNRHRVDKDYSISQMETDIKRLREIDDDPFVNIEAKTEANQKLYDMITELGGDFNRQSGAAKAEVTELDKEEILKVRKFAIENKSLLKKQAVISAYAVTQPALNDIAAGKQSIFAKVWSSLKAMALPGTTAIDIAGEVLDVASNPETKPEDVEQAAEKAKIKAARIGDPRPNRNATAQSMNILMNQAATILQSGDLNRESRERLEDTLRRVTQLGRSIGINRSAAQYLKQIQDVRRG